MATTFPSFPSLPLELRLLVYAFAHEDELQTRRVILWDGRVMPLKCLASPLLRVGVEARKCTRAFYSVQVTIHKIVRLSQPPMAMPYVPYRPYVLNRDEFIAVCRSRILRIPGATSMNSTLISYWEPAGVSAVPRRRKLVIDLNQAWIDFMSDHLAAQVKRFLGDWDRGHDQTVVAQGILYLSPARDLLLYGYNCGPAFFDLSSTMEPKYDPNTGKKLKRRALNPACRHFSSKLPVSFYPRSDDTDKLTHFLKSQRSLLVVQPAAVCPGSLHPNLRSRLHDGELCTREEILGAYGLQTPMLVFRTLTLGKEESTGFVAALSTSPRQLPGKLDVWSSYHTQLQLSGSNTSGDDTVRYQPRPKAEEALRQALVGLGREYSAHEELLGRYEQDPLALEYHITAEKMRKMREEQKRIEQGLHDLRCFARWRSV